MSSVGTISRGRRCRRILRRECGSGLRRGGNGRDRVIYIKYVHVFGLFVCEPMR